MPNWCCNELEIIASKEAMAFIEEKYCRDGMLKFANIVTPSEKSAFAQDDAWGTKWDLDDEDAQYSVDDYVEDNGDATEYKMLTMNFQTAWSPPIEAFSAMFSELQDRFGDSDEPTIKLTFLEVGNAFGGIWEDGNTTEYGPGDPEYKALLVGFGYELEDFEDLLDEEEDDEETFGTAYFQFKLPHDMTPEQFDQEMSEADYSLTHPLIQETTMEEVEYPYVLIKAYFECDQTAGMVDEISSEVDYNFGHMEHPDSELIVAYTEYHPLPESDPLAVTEPKSPSLGS